MVVSPRFGTYAQVHVDSLFDAANDNPSSSQQPDTANSGGSSDDSPPRFTKAYICICLTGYAMSFIVFGSQVSILGPTIRGLSEGLHVEETDLSPLFTALGISCIISGTPSGWVVDAVPAHRVLIASLLVQAVGFALVPLMPSVLTLTALFFCICFSYNFTNSAVFTSLGWMFPGHAGSAFNLVLAAFGIGSFCIPLAAQLCAQTLGSSVKVFFVISAFSAAAAVPFLFVTSPTRPVSPLLIIDTADGSMTADGRVVSSTSTSSDGGGRRSLDGATKRRRRAERLELTTTFCGVLLVFLSTCAETAIGNWIYTYTMVEAGLSDTDATLSNSLFWGLFTTGRIIGALVSHRVAPSVLLLGSVPFAVAGCVVPLVAGRAHLSRVVVMLLAALSGFGNSTGYANAVALLERFVQVTGFINGLFGAMAGAAAMVGPVLVAGLVKYTDLGYQSMPWVGLVLYVLHVPLILVILATGRSLLELSATVASLEDPLLAAEQGGGHTTSTIEPDCSSGRFEPSFTQGVAEGGSAQEAACRGNGAAPVRGAEGEDAL